MNFVIDNGSKGRKSCKHLEIITVSNISPLSGIPL